eukprot:SAG11_NODE_2631_length_3155_cov_2.254908_3_plen_143_part_00
MACCRCHPDKAGGDARAFQALADAYTLLAEAALGRVERVPGKAVVTAAGKWHALAEELDASEALVVVDGTGDGRIFLSRFYNGGSTPYAILGGTLKSQADAIHRTLVQCIAARKPFVVDLAAECTRERDVSFLLCKLQFVRR